MRQRFQNMSEEERAAMRGNRDRSRQPDDSGQGGAGQPPQQGNPGQ